MPLKLVPPRKGKSPNYTIRGTYLGVSVDRSARTARKAVAEQQRKLLEGRIERGEFPEKPAVGLGETFIAAAVSYMRGGGERENLGRLISYFGETPIAEIGQAEIDAAALALYPTATPATRNRKVYTPVSAVLHRAGRDIQIKRPKGAKGRIVTDFLSVDDAFAIIDAADRDDRAFGMLLRFLLYTGCRISEAMALRWEQVDFDLGVAYIATSKNDDPRTVLLQAELREEMRTFAGDRRTGQVFPFRRGGGLKDRLTRAKLHVCGIVPKPRHGKETKADRRIPPHRLSWVGFHTFCHTWATWMRRYGRADVQGLVATGRWRDPRSAARYAHVAAREEWGRVDSLPKPRVKSVES
ncbi:tyrosine-type recombinase/integrase [Rhodopseudomonas telluris]|uniref:Tyrosine-type recombinase/integrase n=1 Tax=Rhodopseudomonas telluris TaxID=644215 RepID=A0ABV6EZH4_9BRAD